MELRYIQHLVREDLRSKMAFISLACIAVASRLICPTTLFRFVYRILTYSKHLETFFETLTEICGRAS